MLGLAWPAMAQDIQVPENDVEIKLSFAPLVKKVSPSVVNIYTKRRVQQQVGFAPLFNDPFFQRFFGRGFGNLGTRERMATSLGSGVIVDGAGLVITNAHVIDSADEINVVLRDGRELSAEAIFSDPRIDLAVLKIQDTPENLPALEVPETTNLEVGDLVLAIGNPFGVGQTVTSGIVSALARTTVGVSDYSFFIQTDAAINPGNSGGALVGMNGDLVGINSAIYSRDGGSLGIGFAIPVELVKTVLNSVKRGEDKLVQPWLGMTGQPVTSDIARSVGLNRIYGAMITQVHPKSQAAEAGVKTGDIITHLNDKPVNDPAAMKFYLAMVEIGDEVVLDVFRDGRVRKVRFIAELPIEDPPRNEPILRGSHPLNGNRVININPAVIEEFDLPATARGVMISEPAERSQLAFHTGDIIARINGDKINSIEQLETVLEEGARAWRLEINRGGRMLSVVTR